MNTCISIIRTVRDRIFSRNGKRCSATVFGKHSKKRSGKKICETLEFFFEQLGHKVYQNNRKVLALSFLLMCLFLSQIPRLSIDTSFESLLHKNDKSRIDYNAFRDQFGQAEMIIIAISPPEVFSDKFLTRLKSFHNDLKKEVPYVKKVNSLINARNTYGKDINLVVEDLLQNWPNEKVNLASLKAHVLNNKTYRNYLISEDGRSTAIVIETKATISSANGINKSVRDKGKGAHYLTEKETQEILGAVHRIMARYERPDFSLALSGGPVIIDIFNQSTWKDARLCVILSLIANVFFLALLFRRISGIIIPIMVILTSLASTVGLMAFFGIPFKLTSAIIPGFLIAVGLADSVHVLSIFYQRYCKGYSKEDSIAYALGHSGQAILMTSVTTAAGVLSFSFAELTAFAEMGTFAAIGVVLALIYTMVLLPALIAVIPIKQKVGVDKKSVLMDKVLLSFADFATNYPLRILVVVFFIFAVSTAFIYQLKFSDNMTEYFPDSMEVKKDIVTIDRELKGMISLEVVIDTKKEYGIYDPEILNRIETLSRDIARIKTDDIYVGKVFSINDIIKEINQALHWNDPSYYRIPQDRRLIAQELLLFETSGADDLEKVVDNQFQKTRFTIKTPWVDSVVFESFIEEIEKKFEATFLDRAEITLTGEMALMARTIPATLNGMAKSYVIAMVIIAIMMIFFVDNIKIGLLSMIPNLLPIFMVMGIIGVLGIPLNMNTLMIGSIAMGLVVDDTVHFIHHFRRYYMKTGDKHLAIGETLKGTGRALLITTLVLSSGFFVFMFASLDNIGQFGFFTGITVILALLADFVVAPALMNVVTLKREVV